MGWLRGFPPNAPPSNSLSGFLKMAIAAPLAIAKKSDEPKDIKRPRKSKIIIRIPLAIMNVGDYSDSTPPRQNCPRAELDI
jgi:hypothetical protein